MQHSGRNGMVSMVLMTLFAALPACAAPRGSVLTGIDVLEQEGFKTLDGKRVGLVTNPTGITRDFRSTVDVLHKAENVKLVALFGPEHGIRGNVTAGGKITDSTDPATGLPEYSLYGATRKPTPEMLKGIDVLVYDIQDIGCRSYTYISTMAKVMEAAAEQDIEVVVLDRPNPLTGNRVEGNILDPKFRSFIGLFEVPYVYGLTCGELANMINGEGWLADGAKCKLTVVPMKGWRRDMWFDQTGLPWVPASPHVPHAVTALFYVATGIMGELHVISEGVGYPMPFELAGAPWIDAAKFAAELNARKLPGVVFRPLTFRPYYGPYEKQDCGGVQVHILDRDALTLVGVQFHVMDVHQRLYPDKKLFGSKRDGMFDKACGTDRVRLMFQEGRSADDILRAWDTGAKEFAATRGKYLMY